MATPRADSITAPSGAVVAAGRSIEAQPDLIGGTVNTLLSSWSGTGFQLLSTLPDTGAFTVHPHGASSWDEARQILWIFGAETHATTSGMNNAVYRWDVADGKVKRMYAPSAWPGEYRTASDSALWADAARTKPWAMHSYRRQRFIPSSKEIEVVYDPADHAQWTSEIREAAYTLWENVACFWYYNTQTGTWRYESAGQRAVFAKRTTSSAVGYAPGWGWYQSDQTSMYRLSEAGVYSSINLLGKLTDNYHDAYYVVNNGADLLKFGGNANNFLWSRTPLANWSATTRKAHTEYPQFPQVMVGDTLTSVYTTAQLPSVQMPDGRILFFPLRVVSDYKFCPAIYDPAADTVVFTGDELALGGTSWTYEFKIAWSVANNCAIWLSHSLGNKVFAYRPPAGI